MSTNTATLLLLLMAIAALGKQIPAHQHDRLHTLSSMQQHTEDLKHEGPTRNLQTVTRAAMRMTMNTSNLGTAIAPTTTATLSFITNIMLVIKQFVKLRFQVYSEQANIVAPTTCVDYTSPSVDVSSGIANSDLHLYVLYQSNSSSTSVATGKYCQVTSGGGSLPDATLARGRPTFGRIRFNTAPTLDGATLTNRLFADTASYALHEVFHIMGFDSSLYSTYIDASTQTTYISAVLQTATGMHSSRSTTKWITTPKVLAWAKDWFGCSSIGGMPVENEGSDGE
jgi:proprotein convertase subtilisin/kexin type 5